MAAYYACAGPPPLANRSVGEAGRPYAASGGVGGNQGRGVLGRGRGCGTCHCGRHQGIGWQGHGKSGEQFKTSDMVGHRPRGHVLLSWPRSAERGQCPGSGVHLSSFSFSWPRMHQLFSSPSSLTPVQAPSCRSGRRAVHHVLASINPSRSVLGENVRDASPAPFLPRKIS